MSDESQPVIPTVYWNVQPRALELGITADALRWQAKLSRPMRDRIWDGIGTQVSFVVLAQVAHVLQTDPPGIFRWTDEAHTVIELCIQQLARRKRMSKIKLGAETGISYSRRPGSVAQPLDNLWDGTAQGIQLLSIAKLCRALNVELGPLFAWGPDIAPGERALDGDLRGVSAAPGTAQTARPVRSKKRRPARRMPVELD